MAWSIYPASQLQSRYQRTWREINDKYNFSHPLLDPNFIIPLYQCFGGDKVILSFNELNDEMIGAALLEKKGKGVWQLFFPSQAPLGPVILANNAGYEKNLKSLMKSLPGITWLIGFQKQDPDFSCLINNKNIEHSETMVNSTTINVEIKTTFQEYWQSRSKNLRKEVARYLRRLEEKDSPVKLIEIRDRNEMAKAVAMHGDIESAGWKGKKGTAIHCNNLQGKFYTNVLENFSETGNSCVYQLYFGEKIAASQLTISQNGMMVLLKTAHDESASNYSPGRLLDYKMMELIFSQGQIRNIEFYTNASRDDSRWTTGSRHIYHINYYQSRAIIILTRFTRKVKKFIKGLR